MEDILIGIGGKAIECLGGPILDRARYLFCFKQFIRELEKAKDELKSRLEEVKERVERASQIGEEMMLPVKRWLNDVEKILEDVQEMQRQVERDGKNWFKVSFRYSLTKKMDNKAKRMTELKKESYFERDFVDFKSRKSTYNNLLEAIKDGKNKMIGLYGIGGSGKTTLAKEVGKKMHDFKLFEKVIKVVVSKPPNVAKLQQEIAELIGLEFQEETPFVRAQRLSNGLKNKKILIILDDVWEYLNLEDVGIPLVEGCHILLTTRLRNVCASMGCEPMIELPLITKEEAWDLFKKHANLCNDPSNIFDDVGGKIVDECKGLPIAIVAVGRSLKGKNIEAWASALWRLQHFQPLNVGQGLRSAYACLELSYSSLPSSTAKSLLLLCSMFPEDHEIHKEDLIRFGMRTLKLEESIVTIQDARRVILDALEILLDSCLLMSIEKEACVKIHDLVRDAALWIAKKQGQKILVESSEVSNILFGNRQNLKDTKALSLWDLDDNFNLSNQLHCSTLEILLLQPHGFIEDLGAIKALKVLALIKYGFEWGFWKGSFVCSIPRSIVSLTYLHTLCIRGKVLGDISLLGELKGLEILDLHGSLFDELPVGIANMKMLKLLDIYDCGIEKSPIEVIGRCEHLEELYFLDQKSVIPHNFSLSRLKRYVLYDATCSIIGAYEDDPFQEYMDSCGEALRALCIQGFRVSASNSSMKNLILRANHLWLENCEWDYKDINFQINHLGVSRCQEKRFIIEKPDVNILQTQQVFSHLITLRLFEMNSLEQVFQDSSIGCSLPMLQELWIRNCPELRICIFSHATITSLPKLRKLHIDGSDKVKWLLSCSLASYCPLLKEIIISDCFEFERLIDEEATHGDPLLHDKQYYPYGKETDSAYVGVTAKRFNQLQNQQSLILFLRLKSLKIERSGKKKGILEIQVRGRVEDDDESIKAQEPLKLDSELSELELDSLPELEYIWKGPTQIVSLCRLEDVSLGDCPRLKSIFTLAIVASLPELRTLKVDNCEEWEGIFCEESLKNLSSSNICFPKLKMISILGCNRVRWLLSYSLASHCPSLEIIWIRYCSEFERLIDEEAAHGNPLVHDMQDYPHGKETDSAYVGVTAKRFNQLQNQQSLILFLRLKSLQIEWSGKKKGILEIQVRGRVEDDEESIKAQEPLKLDSEMSELKLDGLPELEYIWKGPTQIVSLHRLENVLLWRCPKLKSIFTLAIVASLPELRTLQVYYCEEWEGIFCEESLKNLSSSNICFPKLKRIDIYNSNKVRWLLSYSLASHCPSLEYIDIDSCSEFEGLIGEEAAHGDPQQPLILFPKLKAIEISYCNKVRWLLSYSLASHCPSLEEITVRNCFQLEGLVKAYEDTITIGDCPNISNIPLEDEPSSSALEIKLQS